MRHQADGDSLREALCSPEGRVGLAGVRAEGPARELLYERTGGHIYQLSYADDLLTLTHSTPGSGTWRAELSLMDYPERGSLELVIAWSPNELRLSAVDPRDRRKCRVAIGEKQEHRILPYAEDGAVVMGAPGLGARAYRDGVQVAGPPAIELWSETREAVRVLLTGSSTEGFLHSVVTTNAALIMLITGLETYCQERFIELEGEGIPLDVSPFLKRFGSSDERTEIANGQMPAAGAAPIDIGRLAARVNFQNFDDVKRAFAKGYGLRIGVDLGLSSQELERIRTLLRYRHRIVHVSPLTTMLNQGSASDRQEREWSKPELAARASREIDRFVMALHQGTLSLRTGATAADS